MYAGTINSKWFALVQVKDKDTVHLSVAPQVFRSICQQTADEIQATKQPAPVLVPVAQQPAVVRVRTANAFTDNTISLAGWTASQDVASSPRPSDRHSNELLKEENKKVILALLIFKLHIS